MNVNRAVLKGYALSLDFTDIREETFGHALNELLTNPKYSNNAMRLSKITKDRPMTPKETVVYWTEHVIRHQGGEHLKSVARHLSFIEYNLIDVYATMTVGISTIFFVFVKFLKKVCSRKSTGKSNDKKQKKQ
jgi:glucuronosyltransferase